PALAIRLCGDNLAERRIRLDALGRVPPELGVHAIRGVERVVEYVVGFRAKTQVKPLLRQENSLEQGHVPVVFSRANEGEPGCGARRALQGRSDGCGVEPLAHRTLVTGKVGVPQQNHTGSVRWRPAYAGAGQFVAACVNHLVDSNRLRRSGEEGVDTRKLPVVEHSAGEPVVPGVAGSGNIPGEGRLHDVGVVEPGAAVVEQARVYKIADGLG